LLRCPEQQSYLRCDVTIAGIHVIDTYIEKPHEDIPEVKNDTVEEEVNQEGLSEEQSLKSRIEKERAEEEKKDKFRIKGTKYEYIVVFDPISWIPECVLRKFSMEYPLIVQRAIKEMEVRKKF
jgi:hypothetical protein